MRLTRDEAIARLGEHLNTDRSVTDAVLDYMRRIGAPCLLREIYLPLELPRTAVNRVLDRALRAGVVARYKIPAPRRCYSFPLRRMVDGVIRPQFLYSLVDGA